MNENKIIEAMDGAHDAVSNLLTSVAPDVPLESLTVFGRYATWLVRAAVVFARRQRVYGVENVVEMGGDGVLARTREKLSRIARIQRTGVDDPDDLATDSALDTANFGVIMAMVMDGEWPEAKWTPKA